MDDDNTWSSNIAYSGGSITATTYDVQLDPTYTVTMPNTLDTTDDLTFTFDGGYGVDNDISVPEDGDIKIGNRSLKTFMDTMEKRLAILQPDPKKLEKFEALQKAYDHYKHIESLCELEEEDES